MSGLIIAIALVLLVLPGSAEASRRSSTPGPRFYLHGQPEDQAYKATSMPDGSHLTFSRDAADGVVPVTQNAGPAATEDQVADPGSIYWSGNFSGTIEKNIVFKWYWSGTPSADPTPVEISVFADPEYEGTSTPSAAVSCGTTTYPAAPKQDGFTRTQPQKLIGRAQVALVGLGSAPTLEQTVIPVCGTVQNTMLVQVRAISPTETGELAVHYDSASTPSNFTLDVVGAKVKRISVCDVVGTAGSDRLHGSRHSDTICGLGGNDVIKGRGGDDRIVGGRGTDLLLGGDGSDVMEGEAKSDAIIGGAGRDRIVGGPGADRLLGGGGNDRVQGSSGGDRLDGGKGRDALGAGPGGDLLIGGQGQDRLKGNGNSDTIHAGGGNDLASGGGGADRLTGDGDKDVLRGGAGTDRLSGAGGNDLLIGAQGEDGISGGPGADRLSGGGGDDRMSGGQNDDELKASDGQDRLFGNTGNDFLGGGAGNDHSYGGPRVDLCRGGGGTDREQCEDPWDTALLGADGIVALARKVEKLDHGIFDVTELIGFQKGVTGSHSSPNSPHFDGRAFDVNTTKGNNSDFERVNLARLVKSIRHLYKLDYWDPWEPNMGSSGYHAHVETKKRNFH